jgi:hypothetical protein
MIDLGLGFQLRLDHGNDCPPNFSQSFRGTLGADAPHSPVEFSCWQD